jgi:hypothetical protein
MNLLHSLSANRKSEAFWQLYYLSTRPFEACAFVTSWRYGTPTPQRKPWRPIDNGQALEVGKMAVKPRVWAQKVKFEAPNTAAKIFAWRGSPVSRSTITGAVSRALI